MQTDGQGSKNEYILPLLVSCFSLSKVLQLKIFIKK
jgi:hypothetical protein